MSTELNNLINKYNGFFAVSGESFLKQVSEKNLKTKWVNVIDHLFIPANCVDMFITKLDLLTQKYTQK